MDPSTVRESDIPALPPDLSGSPALDLLVAAAKKIEHVDDNRGRGLSRSFKSKKPKNGVKYVLVDPKQVQVNLPIQKQVNASGIPMEEDHQKQVNTTMDHDQTVNKNQLVYPTTEKEPNSKKSVFRTLYDPKDPGPYIVHVQFAEENGKSGATLHPLDFSYFLFQNGMKDIIQNGVKRIGRNRLSISFGSWKEANLFVLNEVLAGQKKYQATIPTFNLCRMGIVKGVPESWTHEEILENIRVPEGYGEILRSRRMNRKTVSASGVVEWVPTQTVTLTFDGQRLPPRVFSFYSALPVQNYILPTIQCHRCCRFGHTKDKCRSRPRCAKCGEEHDAATCMVTVVSCVNCSGDHQATAKICPEFLRQTEIKKYMSENNESYLEASKVIPNSKPLFSEVVGRESTPNSSVPVQSTENRKVWNKKTVTLPPKIKRPVTQGYDHKAHKDLVNSFKEPTPENGCGFKTVDIGDKETDSQACSLQDLLSQLVNIVLNSSLPYNVALSLINSISVAILNLNHGLSHPVEPQKHSI
ncbi:hypothetical protein NE865_04980 [Phthorimaea operculella]|nr:hypothetical protein NE865_04980 [Phthorimaea operculella]